MLRKQNRFIAVVVMAAFCLVACSCATTHEGKAYDVLNVASITYDASMATLGELHSMGKLSNEDAYKAIEMSEKFQLAHKTARETLKTYLEILEAGEQGFEQKEILDIAISVALKAQVLLTEFLAEREGG